ncbi:MAG: tetratricopeptide repeat protein [Acidobacteriota bacterium]
MKTYRLAFGLVVFILIAFSVEAEAKDKWLNLQTKNFNVVSNADEGATRDLLLKLEQFRAAFAKIFRAQNTTPITLMVFKSDDSFKPFKPLYNGKPANLSGYFQRSADEDIIALNIDAKSEEFPLAVIFHEYTHYLTSRAPRRWPAWLNEGIAEVYSTFLVNKNKVTLGSASANRLLFLRDKKMLSLKELFNVGQDSPIYNERDKQSIFYAQSWALVHYLMLGDKLARQPQLTQFVRLINEGANTEAAFLQIFKTDFATVEKNLRDYVNLNAYTIVTYTLDSIEGEKEVTSRPLSDAEIQYYLGNLLLRTQRLDESEEYFKQAIALDANFAAPYEGMGFAALRKNNFPASQQYFKQAVERGSKNYLTHFYYAQELYNDSLRTTRDIKSATYKSIVDSLKTSISLSPYYAHARALLAHVYMLDTDKQNLALQEMKTALALEPQNAEFRRRLAEMQLFMRDFAAARKTLEPMLASDDAQAKSSAERLLKAIDAQEKFIAESKERNANVTTPNSPPTDGRVYEESPQQRVLIPPRVADLIAQSQNLSGVITAIECKGNTMVMTLKDGAKLAKFFIADYDKIPMFSRKGFYDVQFVCGANKIPAVIYFKPSSDKRVNGEAVVIEIVN